MSGGLNAAVQKSFAIIALIAAGAVAASAQVTASPNPVAFGSVGIGLNASHAVSFTNSGTKAVTLESYTFADPVHFGVVDGNVPVTINPGQTLAYSWGFTPTAAVAYNSSVTLVMSGTSNVTVTVTGTGESNSAIASLSTTAINFGSIPLGTTVSQDVTVTNTGTAEVNISALKIYEPFGQTGYNSTVSLGAGKSFTFVVSYTPVNVGPITGGATLDFNLIPSVGIALTGTGTQPSGLAVVSYPTLPAATVGNVYQNNPVASGGTPPYSWSVSGSTVSGLSLNSSTGQISGTVGSGVTVGNYAMTLTVTDSTKPTPLQASQAVTLPVDAATGANCAIDYIDVTGTETPSVALNDLGTGTYQGYQGGLYPNGSNVDPNPHDSDAVAIGQTIQPRDADGTIDPVNGEIVILSLGQSTTQQPFVDFIDILRADPAKNPKVVAIQGAMGGATAQELALPDSPYLATILNYMLPYEGVTPEQVSVGWVNAEDSDGGAFPGDATAVQAYLETLAQILHTNFPNLALSYWGSLNYTGYSLNVDPVDPEPQGYESAFAVKWAIQDQINGNSNLNYNPNNGPVVAPWMGWGPYYWANGLINREDGTYWSCPDMNSDGLHPGTPGHYKIIESLLNFFKTTDSTTPWFLPTPAVSLSPTSLTFASQAVGTTSSAQTVTLTNTGTAPLAITGISITGTNSGDFAETNTCGTSVAAGAACSISVTFTPSASGTRTASVSIADNATGSPQTVGLTGTGGGGPVVSLNPTSLTFPLQLVLTSSSPMNVTLQNTGSSTLTITSITMGGSNPNDFSQTNTCGSSVAAGASCTITVTFTAKAKGARSASLSVADNAPGSPQTVSLSGTGTIAKLTPSSVNFGNQNVGTTSAAQTVTLANVSTTNAIKITSVTITGTNASDFAETNNCPASLAVSSSCTINVTFTPPTSGAASGTLNVNDDGGGTTQSVSLSGTGVTGGPAVTLTPTSLTFPVQVVYISTAPMNVTLLNSGSATLSVTGISITGADPNDFSQTNTCGTSVAAGASCTISVTFTPKAKATRTASVSIADNATGSPQTVSLTGTGTIAKLTPSSLSFGNQNVGTASAAQTVTLNNVSTSNSIKITSVSISGTNSSDFAETNNCPATLAFGASCTINVTFTPAAAGSRSGTLNVNDDGGGSTQSVSLTGTGVSGTPSVTLNPTSLSFPVEVLHVSSPSQNVTLTNTGSATLNITSITLTGANPTDFSQSNTCGSTVAAGASCTISVTFTPVSKNMLTASVSVADNATGSPQTVSLTGTGTTVQLTPSSLNFGNQGVGTSSAVQTVTLKNVSTLNSVSITSITIAGSDPSDFTETNNCGSSVAVGASCTISVTFTPTKTGARTGTVSVIDNAGGSPQTATLSGTGT